MQEVKYKLKTVNFSEHLKQNNLEIKVKKPEILQLNLGYLCNLQCSHCHVDASPTRKEIMSKEVLISCLQKIDELEIHTVDLTGGAPEMNPHFEWLLEELSKRKIEIIVRSNLTILVEGKFKTYPELLKKHKVHIISSLPCYTEENVDKQRGNGVFNKSIKALKILNELGYGKEENLILDLVYNPTEPSVPPDQFELEKDYKLQLKNDFDITFNHLFCITNIPINRFKEDLIKNGTYDSYMQTLVLAFNPLAAKNVMCTNTLSVSHDGKIYDCDFNQMLKLEAEGINRIEDLDINKLMQRKIKVDNHCFGCTAGSGSSCQGAIT